MRGDWGMTNLAIIWGIIEALFSIIFILCYSNFRKLWGGCLLSLCVSLASFLVWCESYYGRWDDGGEYGVECPDVLISCDNYHFLYEPGWGLYWAATFTFVVSTLVLLSLALANLIIAIARFFARWRR
ncbi:hypothetical protein AHX05_03430 [Salmonella enterica subsp. indica]|uniref:Uncharacterized protein n=2 Tax=Salmonella enterica TaxID=28901 RepID=A0A701ZGX8_SALER|nr:hypothetical protein [Salmonella enterica subsp. indica]EEJ9032913.1 hypothetical protein [Salmonella enterica subsp. enterica serovar Oslo]MBA3214470.1 hypothetical protein [Salmonella enterica]ECG1336318.1 hypothetical protein [Salmonella enterica subsp. indica]HAC6576546.1 hypothetical protein [Salmonella enterica subsp. indica]